MPLEGLDGGRKMSKSLGNWVALEDPPDDMFGKLMSVSDDLMWRYLELLSELTSHQLAQARASVDHGRNPMEVKFELARELVSRLHSPAAAADAHERFLARFRRRELPTSLPSIDLDAPGGLLLGAALRQGTLARSNSDAMRLIMQGAVKVNGQLVNDPKFQLTSGGFYTVEIGKRTPVLIHLK